MCDCERRPQSSVERCRAASIDCQRQRRLEYRRGGSQKGRVCNRSREPRRD